MSSDQSITSLEALLRTLQPALDSLVSFSHAHSTMLQSAQGLQFKIYEAVTQKGVNEAALLARMKELFRENLERPRDSREGRGGMDETEQGGKRAEVETTAQEDSVLSSRTSELGKRTRSSSDPPPMPPPTRARTLNFPHICTHTSITNRRQRIQLVRNNADGGTTTLEGRRASFGLGDRVTIVNARASVSGPSGDTCTETATATAQAEGDIQYIQTTNGRHDSDSVGISNEHARSSSNAPLMHSARLNVGFGHDLGSAAPVPMVANTSQSGTRSNPQRKPSSKALDERSSEYTANTVQRIQITADTPGEPDVTSAFNVSRTPESKTTDGPLFEAQKNVANGAGLGTGKVALKSKAKSKSKATTAKKRTSANSAGSATAAKGRNKQEKKRRGMEATAVPQTQNQAGDHVHKSSSLMANASPSIALKSVSDVHIGTTSNVGVGKRRILLPRNSVDILVPSPVGGGGSEIDIQRLSGVQERCSDRIEGAVAAIPVGPVSLKENVTTTFVGNTLYAISSTAVSDLSRACPCA